MPSNSPNISLNKFTFHIIYKCFIIAGRSKNNEIDFTDRETQRLKFLDDKFAMLARKHSRYNAEYILIGLYKHVVNGCQLKN